MVKSVEIKVKDTKDKVVIIIDDDGPGIPDREKERVLRPFYRLDKSRTSSSGVSDLDYQLYKISSILMVDK